MESISLNTRRYGKVEAKKNNFKVFEFFAEKTQAYDIKVESCVGKSELILTRDFSEAFEGEYELREQVSGT